MSMRQSFRSHGLFFSLLLLLLLSSYTTRATRLLQPQQGNEGVKINGFTQVGHSEEAENDAWKLMGLESCENENEECLKRRILVDAHLDYIYTQHHKP